LVIHQCHAENAAGEVGQPQPAQGAVAPPGEAYQLIQKSDVMQPAVGGERPKGL
jgi:hypothetical protein